MKQQQDGIGTIIGPQQRVLYFGENTTDEGKIHIQKLKSYQQTSTKKILHSPRQEEWPQMEMRNHQH